MPGSAGWGGHRRCDDRLSPQAVDPQPAVRWLRLHAGELRVDPSPIFVLGDPAGAQITLYVAALGHTVAGDDAAALPCVSSSNRSQLGHMWPPHKLLFGSDGQTRPVDQERAASPLFIIGAETAPVMIAHGHDDESVTGAASRPLGDLVAAPILG